MAEIRSREVIAANYQAVREEGDVAAMRRFQNEETCLVLIAILEHLAVEPETFIHRVALKGGILMAGELRSPRSSADIDATTGRQRRIDPGQVIADLRRAGRAFNVRLGRAPLAPRCVRRHKRPSEWDRLGKQRCSIARHCAWRHIQRRNGFPVDACAVPCNKQLICAQAPSVRLPHLEGAMSVEVRAIELPQDAVRFCKTWWPIYADDPHWVPPLLSERKEFLDPDRNPFFRRAQVQCFMAFRDGTAVGTIAATVVDPGQGDEPGVGYFGFFEFGDDIAVSRALFEAATGWLRSHGQHAARGPYSLSPHHEFGLRVEGWDSDPALLNPHNRDYFARHYEALGLVGVRDWYAYWLDRAPVPERLARASRRFLEQHPEVEIRHLDMSNWDEEIMWFRDIYNDAWESNWGHARIPRDEFMMLARGMKQMIDPRLSWWALVDGEPAGAAITLPDYNQVVKKMDGRLLPFGWYHWLFGRRRIDAIRIFALGVKQQYRSMPLGVPLYVRTWEAALARGALGADASLVLEDNLRMRGALEKLGARIYQTYRIYEYRLDGSDVVAPSVAAEAPVAGPPVAGPPAAGPPAA